MDQYIECSIGLVKPVITEQRHPRIQESGLRRTDAKPYCRMVVHVLKETASRFETNFHVRGTDYFMKQPYMVQQGGKELLPD